MRKKWAFPIRFSGGFLNQVVTTSFLLRPANSQLLGGGNKTGAILNDSIHSEIECVLWVTFPRAATQKIESLRPLRKDTLVTTWFKKMPDFLAQKCEPTCDSKKCEKVRGRKHKSLSPPEVWGSCRLFFWSQLGSNLCEKIWWEMLFFQAYFWTELPSE